MLTSAELEWLMPAALATLIVGSIGILASRSLGQQASFATIASVGTLFVSISGSSPIALSAGLYYMVHSTLCIAGIFLVVDMVIANRPGFGDALVESPKYAHQSIIAFFYFTLAVAISGVPPLSGFIGKILVLLSSQDSSNWQWIWLIILVSSFIGLVGMARSGSLLFWKCSTTKNELGTNESNKSGSVESPTPSNIVLPSVACGTILALILMLSVFAGPISQFMDDTAEQLYDSKQYVNSVLGEAK